MTDGLRISVDAESCVGCSRCVLACSFEKEGAYSRAKARIRVSRQVEKGLCLPIVCRQCKNPVCIDACDFGALRINTRGFVSVDEKACTGCLSCAAACPFGAIFIHPKKKIAMLCDLCDGKPVCVKYCVTKAITLVDSNTLK